METAPTGDWNISTTVKKADSSIIEKPLELEGEGGSSVNYLDVTISIRRNRLRWTLYDKKKFIFIDGKALSESPNFPWYDSKLTERSKIGVVTSEMVRYSRRTDTKNDFIAHTMALIKKMVKFGYEKRKVMRKVQSFRHFSCVSVLYQRNTRVASCAICYSSVSLV